MPHVETACRAGGGSSRAAGQQGGRAAGQQGTHVETDAQPAEQMEGAPAHAEGRVEKLTPVTVGNGRQRHVTVGNGR